MSRKYLVYAIGLVSLFIFCASAFAARNAAAAASPAQIGGTPARPVVMELKDFNLCELDKKSGRNKSGCIKAVVPGDVFTALMDAGRIPDPYKDANSKKAQWVDERDWRYESAFEYQPSPGRRSHLLFMGLDYISRIELNGKVLVQKHEGMFSRIDLDITDVLDPSGRQKLSVTLFTIPNKIMEQIVPMMGLSEWDRRHFLKTQMSFGWDFAPRLKGAGIWDRVYIYETGPLSIKDIFVQTKTDGRVDVEVELSGSAESRGEASLEVEIAGETFKSEPLKKSAPVSAEKDAVQKISFAVAQPKLWWPWDMGEQDLYRAQVRVLIQGRESDRASEVFGIREISWGPNPNAPEGSADWVLFVNGKREFMRGGNFVPAEAMSGRLDDERYLKILTMAKDIGVNMLRVWGGGNRERRAFYDYCDREGILVWQEFPLACVFIMGFPKTDAFQDLLRSESEEIVRQLRNHPALFMWCGGNEFNAVQNAAEVKVMEQVTARLDPTRRFIPASPYKGDSHNWVVWHQMGNLYDYFSDISPFPSEFGMQAFPAVDTLKKWISPKNLWPINDVLEHHNLGAKKMDKYASVIHHENTLDSYAEATQIIQAHYLQRGIENWRQRKYATSGTAFWQLNEPWPAICWSVIDYELQPKYSYKVLKNSYNPVLITAKYDEKHYMGGDRFEAEVMVVNDLHRGYKNVRVTAALCGTVVGEWENVTVPEDDVLTLGLMTHKVPGQCDKPVLELKMEAGDCPKHSVIAANSYDLWIYDAVSGGRTSRTIEKVSKYIMSGAKQKNWQKP